MDVTPLPPEPEEPPLTDEEQAWLAGLLDEVGPEGAYKIAELLDIDLDRGTPEKEDAESERRAHQSHHRSSEPY